MIQQYIINRVSLNRNAHKIRLYIDCLTEMSPPGTHRLSPARNGSIFTTALPILLLQIKRTDGILVFLFSLLILLVFFLTSQIG